MYRSLTCRTLIVAVVMTSLIVVLGCEQSHVAEPGHSAPVGPEATTTLTYSDTPLQVPAAMLDVYRFVIAEIIMRIVTHYFGAAGLSLTQMMLAALSIDQSPPPR
ncbi:hypothetical protein GF420_06310 [candidate division GN15 bacterium]|nr:hypothetical protein [candidate division GN15 bacterium]